MAESERSKVSLRSASEKRSRGSPTGCTPLQKGKRSTTELKEVGESQQTGSHHCQPRRRRLAFAKTDAWSDSDQIALVGFILLHKQCLVGDGQLSRTLGSGILLLNTYIYVLM